MSIRNNTTLLVPREVAARLRVTEGVLAKWRLTGEPAIPYVTIGGRVRYPAQGVEDMIAASTRLSTSDRGGA